MKRAALAGELLRTLLVAVAFLLISRELPLEEVGIISAITATLAIIGPIAALGLPFRILRDSAQGDSNINYRSALLTICLLTGPLFVAVCLLLVYPFSQSAALWAVAALVFAECWLLISFQLLSSTALGSSNPSVLLCSNLLVSVPRIVASVLLIFQADPSVEQYAGTLLILAIPALLVMWRLLPNQGPTRFLGLQSLTAERSASGYSTGSALLSRCSDDMDKLFLGFMRGAGEVAIYSIPYRLTFYAMIPGRAVLSSRLSQWYKNQGWGIRHEVMSVAGWSTLAGSILSLLIYLMWPLLCSLVIGEQYLEAQVLILAFSVAIVLRGIHYALGEVLFARRRLASRTGVQAVAIFIGVVAMILLIPRMGAHGAALVTIAIELVTLLGYLVVLNAKK